MKITRNNYEIFFLDYMEEKLSKEKIAELMVFISENPDLKEELDEFEVIKLSPEKAVFNNKFSLKKVAKEKFDINEINFDEICIAKLEGDLLNSEIEAFKKFIEKNPAKKEVFKSYAKTILQIDNSIRYQNKKALKKTRTIHFRPQLFLKYASIAAAIIILFLVTNNIDSLVKKPAENIAQSYTDDAFVEKAVQVQNQLADGLTDNKKTETRKKDEIKNQNKKSVKTKSDTIQQTPVRSKNLKPLIINNGQNFRFTMEKKSPGLHASYTAIANVDFKFEEDEFRTKPKHENNYLALNEIVVNRFKRLVLGEEYNKEKEITYLDFVKAGISGIDKIIPGKIEFEHESNTNGEIEYLALNTKYIGYSRTFKK